jgi:trk system potassium uptake protein TrkH
MPGRSNAGMIDLRPVAYVNGVLLVALGLAMLVPMAADMVAGNGHWKVFAQSAIITTAIGGLMALASANGVSASLSIRQTFVLTTLVWVLLPLFGALPFMLGITDATAADAVFEAMSGFTTTGATVFVGLETLPAGLLLWRGIMQWLGGIGIIVMAMVFLPELKVGGMQVFRSEAFETMGKILPRAAEIARGISVIYIGLTLACALGYLAAGMTGFDAAVHAMTTVSTGGFANYDSSFGDYGAAVHYIAILFMLGSALPFVRFVQLVGGDARPLLRDSQVRVFLAIVALATAVLAVTVTLRFGGFDERVVREALFNVASIITGTGFAMVDYMGWGEFAITLIFFLGLIGGCAGSTSCSVKVFRYQILFASIRAEIRRLQMPRGVFTPRFEGRPLTDEVLDAVMAFFGTFVLSLGLFTVALNLAGLDALTAVSGAATALANIGPGLGEIIGPAGNFAPLSDTAKWILTLAMLVGRLELMVVLVLFTARFWRD